MPTTTIDPRLLRAVAPLREPGRRVPGLTVATVDRGRVRIAAHGIRDLGTGASMAPDTRLLWFSMTKIATATAVVALRDAGLLDLDRPAIELVPTLGRIGGAGAVTVRQLLQHTSGLPDPLPLRWVRPAATAARPADEFLAARLARVRRLRTRPGTRASYSNLGYLVLGAVVATTAGLAFPQALTELVLGPLGMDGTRFDLGPDPAAVAIGHQRVPRGGTTLLRTVLPPGIVGDRSGAFVAFRPFLVEGAAYGGLVGPVGDAARLARLYLEGGSVDGHRILAESSVAEMQRIDATGRARDHGLGWFRSASERDRRPPVVEHYGGGAGYRTLMRLVPDLGRGVVVMGNSGAFAVSELADRLLAATA